MKMKIERKQQKLLINVITSGLGSISALIFNGILLDDNQIHVNKRSNTEEITNLLDIFNKLLQEVNSAELLEERNPHENKID